MQNGCEYQPRLHETTTQPQPALGDQYGLPPPPNPKHPSCANVAAAWGPSHKNQGCAHRAKHRGVSYTYPSMYRHICQAHAAASHMLCCDAVATRPGGLTTSQNRCKHGYNKRYRCDDNKPKLGSCLVHWRARDTRNAAQVHKTQTYMWPTKLAQTQGCCVSGLSLNHAGVCWKPCWGLLKTEGWGKTQQPSARLLLFMPPSASLQTLVKSSQGGRCR